MRPDPALRGPFSSWPRGQGHRTTLSRLTLERARELGLKGVWIVCDSDNRASVVVAERCGAALQEEVLSSLTDAPIRRYWAAL